MKQFIFYKILIINILSIFSLPAQETKPQYERTITVSQFIKELQDTSKKKVYIEKTNIEADTLDRRFTLGAGNSKRQYNWDSILATYPPIVIEKYVVLMDVRFGQRTILPKLIFKNDCHLERIKVYGDLTFRSCTFEGYLNCVNFESYFYKFIGCEFKRMCYFESITTEQTTFLQCRFLEGVYCYQNDEPLNSNFHSSYFNGDCSFQLARGGGELTISNTVFESSNPKHSVLIGGGFGFLERLILVQDTFKIPLDFQSANIKDNFILSKCQLHTHNLFHNINIPENSTNARWSYLKDYKFSVPTSDTTYFNGKTPLSDDNEENYYEIIKVYSQFLRAYKNNGDQESYNACYIEMKDIQTRKAAFNFHKAPSVSNYFDWKLNRFLKLFCDYGTNPVKALLMSAIVIVVFGLLYFIFPSEETTFKPKTFWNGLKNYKNMKRTVKNQTKTGLKQMLNAMALSMNAFVTLGYGDMPAKGVARYLAVFEGLTGWFLLSIFSSSLISQILQ